MSEDSNTARDALRELASEAKTLLKRSDTFAWLTTKAPNQLDERAQAATSRIGALRNANNVAASSSVSVTDDEFAATVKLAEAEARLQRTLATLLRELGQPKGKPAKDDA
jgi:hypothetical protein